MTAPTAPTVSVIVPTHNRADLIGETLRSILAQTFGDFEVIVVDNGSTDGTDRLVEGIGDSRIRYFWQEDSGLPANSRNVGIRLAHGRYVAFLDSDDLWLPGKLELQVAYMEAHPSIAMTFTNAESFETAGTIGRLIKISMARRSSLAELLMGNFIPGLTVMVRRVCLDAIGFFSEDRDLRGIEDFNLWLRIAARYPFAYLNQCTARYRIHPGNLAASDRIHSIRLGIAMLERLPLPVERRTLDRGVACHYRRLARECAYIGNENACRNSFEKAMALDPSIRSRVPLLIHRLLGFKGTRMVLQGARDIKYLIDRIAGKYAAGMRGQGQEQTF